jgi:hypothetical protein
VARTLRSSVSHCISRGQNIVAADDCDEVGLHSFGWCPNKWSFSCEGNMINALDESNPTHLLLSSLSDAGIYSPTSPYPSQPAPSFFKDGEQFALGVLDANGQVCFA